MGNSLFLRRLRKELPDWLERGWITPGADQSILDYVAGHRPGGHLLAYTLSVLGVLLLGSGIVTWFAANWGAMAKLGKLLVLFGSLWLTYGASAYLRSDDRYPLVGQALLLLGVILFGANIMLVAQIYHIDSHFPNGVLLWALGGLMTAYLLDSEPALVAAIVLGTLWTGLESAPEFAGVHWWFLLLWVSLLPLIVRHEWKAALHGTLLGLLIWSVLSFLSLFDRSQWASQLYLIQIYLLAYVMVFLVGVLMGTVERLARLATAVQHYGALAAVACLYVLTFPGVHTGVRWLHHQAARGSATAGWVIATVLGVAGVLALALAHHRHTAAQPRPPFLVWGQSLVGGVLLLCLVNLFPLAGSGGTVAVAFNLLFFSATVWLIYAGLQANDRFFVNLAFIFFALGLGGRYIDTFWTLLNRSFFFMGGGVILLAGGYALERQRRRLTRDIALRREQGPAR